MNQPFPWHLWQSPGGQDLITQAILASPRALTPLLHFFNRILLPQMVKQPTWVEGLGLDGNNVKVFIISEAEGEILSLFLDVTHRSFLQFCTYLVHERLVEYSHLKRLFPFTVCPVIITLAAVQTAIHSFLPIFEYRDVKDMCNVFSGAAQYRRDTRTAAILHDVVYKNMTNYIWSARDKNDIVAFQKLLKQLFHHPVYSIYTYSMRGLIPEDMNDLRCQAFRRRQELYNRAIVPPPPLVCSAANASPLEQNPFMATRRSGSNPELPSSTQTNSPETDKVKNESDTNNSQLGDSSQTNVTESTASRQTYFGYNTLPILRREASCSSEMPMLKNALAISSNASGQVSCQPPILSPVIPRMAIPSFSMHEETVTTVQSVIQSMSSSGQSGENLRNPANGFSLSALFPQNSIDGLENTPIDLSRSRSNSELTTPVPGTSPY